MEPGHVRVRRDPLGVTLVIGAWNEPFMLTLGPLVSAIAAGNTAVVKPSEVAEASAAVVAEMIPTFLDPNAVAVVTGGVPETTALLDQHWDLIFFTGSPAIGKIIHQAAARHLTPTVLELGGKNPTVVHSSANIKSAARRIAFGRFANSGHICTAPDHVLVWPEVKEELVAELKEAIHDFYGDDPPRRCRPTSGHWTSRCSTGPPRPTSSAASRSPTARRAASWTRTSARSDTRACT